MPLDLVPPSGEVERDVAKVNFLPNSGCHRAGQTGVTGDKGQTGEKGITGDAGEFDKTSCTVFQDTVILLNEQICKSISDFARTKNIVVGCCKYQF